MAKQIPRNAKSKEKSARVLEGHTQQFGNLLLVMGACDSRLYPNVHRLLLIACKLPITSADAERSFFLLRRLKTSARSTMAEERLAHLSVIAMHYQDWVPADEVCTKSSTEIVHTVFV